MISFSLSQQNLIYFLLQASVSMMQIIKETCSHISMLQREVKEHGERLAELVNSAYTSDVDEECLRKLHL